MTAATSLSVQLSEELTNGTYECAVCSEAVQRQQELWSCRCCYGVFHLRCIQFWSSSQAKEREQQLRSSSAVADVMELNRFRCPLCQSFNDVNTTLCYKCFCGKATSPAMDAMLVPGSCGEPCGRAQEDQCCPHKCTLLCHPGPCPPCTRARQQACYCGKQQKAVGCSSGIHGYECGKVCDKLLDCGHHRCTAPCHEGPCPVCTVMRTETCFCGATSRQRRCGQAVEKEEGVEGFRCKKFCEKMRDCDHHVCGRLCHAGPCEVCLRAPERQKFCPCGKTRVAAAQRSSCLDPVPSCGLVCELPLPCGHTCTLVCHDDTPCAPCKELITMPCACGSRQLRIPCFCQYLPQEEWETARAQAGLPRECVPSAFPPTCNKPCSKPLSCHRHKCAQTCCVDREHTCLNLCSKKLSCGLHQCGQLCHAGACPPCEQVSYERLYCRCRRTWVDPPVPCGTVPPKCDHPCSIPRPCGHPANHPCHLEPLCPKCVVLVEKKCGSHGKPMPYHMPCHLEVITCGRKCGKNLPCCGKLCELTCHDGACEHKCANNYPTFADLLKQGKGKKK